LDASGEVRVLTGREPGSAAEQQDAGIVAGNTAAVLDGVHRPDINLAIWRRSARRAVIDAARAWITGPAFEVRAVCRPDHVALHIADALSARDEPAAEASAALIADIDALARRFAALAAASLVEVRLEHLDDDACRLFHADYVGIRLLCTYAGPGTEWVPNAAVVRAALGQGSNLAICPDPAAIRRLPPFGVGLFKGEAYPGNRGGGIVHRSPPIAAGRGRRLLVCISEFS